VAASIHKGCAISASGGARLRSMHPARHVALSEYLVRIAQNRREFALNSDGFGGLQPRIDAFVHHFAGLPSRTASNLRRSLKGTSETGSTR